MPVIPATREAEAGESFESGVAGVEVAVSQDHATVLHPGCRVRLSGKKKPTKQQQQKTISGTLSPNVDKLLHKCHQFTV